MQLKLNILFAASGAVPNPKIWNILSFLWPGTFLGQSERCT